MDYVTTVIFLIEVVIKVIGSGFIINGEKSYLRNAWNVIDFFIVIISLLDLFPTGLSLGVLKIVRMARLLRPLRVISKNEALKLSIKALVVAIPAIANLMVIVLLVMFIFGIIGVNLLKGKSNYCDTSNMAGLSQNDIEKLIVTKIDCLNYGGVWRLYHHNFDNIGSAMTQMIVMSQVVNWAPIMYKTTNSNGPDKVAGYKVSTGLSAFFIVFVIFGAFFITNLFVGVVISAYNRES
jgi:hypothetical protein